MSTKNKFRAWHKLLQEYVEISEYAIIDEDGVVGNNNLVIEQYIGTSDSNGIELYEGDVIVAELITRYGGRLGVFDGVIVFDEMEFCVELFNSSDFPIASWHLVDNCVKIGDIHDETWSYFNTKDNDDD